MTVRRRGLFMFSMVLLVGFGYSAISQLLFLARAERDVSVVRELRAKNGRCGGKLKLSCTKFFATVEFQTADGRQSGHIDAGYVGKHDQPVSKALYQPGDHIPVVFDPNRPEEIYRDKFWDLWGASLIVLFMQICTLGGSFLGPEPS